MNPAYYIPIVVMLLIVFLSMRSQKQMMVKQLMKKRNSEDEMIEFAKRFIDKECLIYTFNGNQIDGIIKEVGDGALLVESKGNVEAVNIDFVMRIREYPRNKSGKKKSVILD